MSFSTLLSDTNGFDVFLYLFPDYPRNKIQIAQVKSEQPHRKIKLEENRRVRAPAFSL